MDRPRRERADRERPAYDVVVVGGGTAGSVAAIAAARLGARTLLIEKSGALGGALAFGMSFLGPADAEGYWSLGGIGRQAIERLRELGGATEAVPEPKVASKFAQDPELLKLVLLQMNAEAGADLLLHSMVVGVATAGGDVESLRVAHKGGVETIRGRAFVDCTADGDLVAMAGAEFTFGRRPDGLTQPASRVFRVGGVDLERLFDHLDDHPEDRMGAGGQDSEPYSADYLRATPGVSFEGFRGLIGRAKRAGEFDIPRSGMILYTFPGRSEVGINITRAQGIDGSDPDDLTRAEVTTQLQMLSAIRFLRAYVPGFESAYLSSAPHQVGIRESRHVVGLYTLTQDDVFGARDFDDQIGRCSYPLDIHDVAPGDGSDPRAAGGGITLRAIERSFGIPARCLLPARLANVAVAGRCISANHAAASSIRGQAPSMVTGHAAGAIAALGAGRGPLRDLDPAAIQAALAAEGAILERSERLVAAAFSR